MSNPPLYPNPNSDPGNTGLRPDRQSPPGTPRWVKAAAIIVIGLILAFVVIHLAGGGIGHHIPLMQPGMQMP